MRSGRRLILVFALALAVLALAARGLLPRILCGRKEAAARKTVYDLRAIADALALYRAGKGGYPDAAGGDIAALARTLAPTYLAELPERDPWGHPYFVALSAESYSLGSYGKDGGLDAVFVPGEHDRAEADTWVVGGVFLAYPKLGCD